MKRSVLIKYLTDQGCCLVREGAKHSWWINPAQNRRTAIPRHREISDQLALKICKDLGIIAFK
ncbi:MAG: type II toxin-antitoxin system HicA family toxin [bacterium]|nr:type II toxin-antitoxin system HicA family toxin [bacterium]